ASWKPRQLNAGTVRAGFDRLAKSLGMEIKLRFTEPHRRQRMAILVTRESHCLEGLLASARAGRLNAEPALLLSNRRDLEPVAQSDGVPFLVIPWENRADAEDRALRVLDDYEIDFIVLARGLFQIGTTRFISSISHWMAANASPQCGPTTSTQSDGSFTSTTPIRCTSRTDSIGQRFSI